MKEGDLKILKERLPRVPGIQGRDEYLNSVILLPLVLLSGEYHLLFQKRSPFIRQGGEISFPGGVFDPKKDGDIRDTALREMFEEMGIPADKVDIAGRMDTVLAPMGAAVDAFIGTVGIKSMDEVCINRDEVEYAFTVPVSHFTSVQPERYSARLVIDPSNMDEEGREVVTFPARELGLPEMYYAPWTGRRYSILVYRVHGEVIWGITARFVHDLVKKLLMHEK